MRPSVICPALNPSPLKRFPAFWLELSKVQAPAPFGPALAFCPLLPAPKMLKAKPYGCPDGQPCPFWGLGASQGRENGSEVQMGRKPSKRAVRPS